MAFEGFSIQIISKERISDGEMQPPSSTVFGVASTAGIYF
ncbi:MAG: hypothetical protein ACJA09_001545 [Alcanivorax sp.]|jgi:hypothetical protein